MKILDHNGSLTIVSQFTILDKLENDYYFLDWDSFGNVSLSKTEKLSLPENIFDINKGTRDIVLKSFNKADKNCGVILVGAKGTGKSIDAKLMLSECNLPIIMISKKVPTNVDLLDFFNKIEQPFCLFVDEFEKLFSRYGSDEDVKFLCQKDLLSLTDGLNNQYKKLFIFTANDDINDYFENRPSRIRFYLKYKGIKREIAEDIVKKLLINKSYAEDLIENLILESLTIDILVSIIEEVNVQDIPYSEFKDIFNYFEEYPLYISYYKEEDAPDYVIDEDLPRYKTQVSMYYNGNTFKKIKTKDKDENVVLFKSDNGKEFIKFVKAMSKLNVVF